ARHAADLARALGLDPIDESAARVAAHLCAADRGTDDCPWSVADIVCRARARPAGSLALAPEEPLLVQILGLAALYDELTESDDAAHRLSPHAATERIGELGAGAVSPRLMEAFRRAASPFVAG
ncbi:MAG: hypothetical protein ACREOC_19540, partial [Gemmatimonadales bacterium]